MQCPDFDREAETLAEAVFEAIATIETAVLGARVVRLEPDDLVMMAEIAIRTGRTRESSRLLVAGERGPGTRPTPATHLRSRHRGWRRPAAARWSTLALGESLQGSDPEKARFVAAFHAGLDMRAHQEGLPAADRRRIRQMVSQWGRLFRCGPGAASGEMTLLQGRVCYPTRGVQSAPDPETADSLEKRWAHTLSPSMSAHFGRSPAR